jgi:hypothetical protein
MTLESERRSEPNLIPAQEEMEDEYRRLLSYQTIEELRASARRWGVRLRESRKRSIVRQLAAWLNDPEVIRARIRDLDELGSQVLVYLHLALPLDYGLAADNIVRGVLRQRERARQQAGDGELLPADRPDAGRMPRDERSAAIQERIATLSQQGLLLPFKRGNAVYYSLPTAVRLCLPSRPDLFAGHSEADALSIRETPIGERIQALYAVWVAIADGLPGTGVPLSRQALPSRQPIEDRWAMLQDWSNDPDEMSAIAAGRYASGRSTPPPLDRLSVGALTWALTVVAPPRRLSDDDLAYVREQTGRSIPEIEFCYVLLEGLGALSGDPGQPVSIHREAMHRFLRLSPAGKVRALWQAWTTHETWSEMESVLRAPAPGAEVARLRRSLAYPDFKPDNLYEEWRAARQAVLRTLSLLDEERWVNVDGYLRTLYSVHPNLLHTQTDVSVWWLESPKTGKQFGTTLEDWLNSHGRFAIAMLEGPLSWLGLVRLGYRPLRQAQGALRQAQGAPRQANGEPSTAKSILRQAQGAPGQAQGALRQAQGAPGQAQGALRQAQDALRQAQGAPRQAQGAPRQAQGALEAFQLTPAGAFALGRRTMLAQSAFPSGQAPVARDTDAAACSVSDDLTVTLLPGRAPVELYDLVHAIGSLVEATPERFIYRLTASGVFRWVEAVTNRASGGSSTSSGDAIETLIAALSKHCAPPGTQPQVAATWQRKLRTWGRNYGQLHVHENLTLLELADEYALQELLVSTSLREHLVYQFSPRLVAIRADTVQELVQEMEKRGYTPRVK